MKKLLNTGRKFSGGKWREICVMGVYHGKEDWFRQRNRKEEEDKEGKEERKEEEGKKEDKKEKGEEECKEELVNCVL